MTAPSETPPPAEAAAAPQKKEKKERKPQTGPPEGYEKKKQLTKAERRELQEKQRAAKAAAKGDAPEAKKGGDAKKAPGAAAPKGGGGDKAPAKESPKPAAPKHTGVLAHLEATSKKKPPSDAQAAVEALGLRYAAGLHDGANERCVAMLAAFKEFVGDYQLAPNTTVNRDLDKKLKPQIQHLIDRRPLSASMGAAVRKLRRCIATLDPEMSAEDAKAALRDEIDAYARERIVLANEVIAKLASEKLRDGDVVVTFGRADAVESALYAAKAAGTTLRVVVVDAAPALEGRVLLRRLNAAGLDCAYCLLHAAPLHLKHATKVVLGADALFSNGAVLAAAGTAGVAMLASAQNVPVLVCCEAYKFHDRVQLDSVASNELVDLDPKGKAPADGDKPRARARHLKYDVTPTTFVSAIVSEHGLLPPSACAVLIREMGESEGKENPL